MENDVNTSAYKFPRGKRMPEKFLAKISKKGCSIDANSTILRNVTIVERAMIDAGGIVTKDIVPNCTVTNLISVH